MTLLRRRRKPTWIPPTGEMVLTTDHGDTQVSHLNGVSWHEAEVPPPDHACYIQTDGWIGFHRYLRCACGAIRGGCKGDPPRWRERNSRCTSL